MLIVALVLAVIGLASLVTAVVTSNELVAWVCIAASVLGVILLIIDALRERQRPDIGSSGGDGESAAAAAAPAGDAVDATYQNFDAEYPDEPDVAPNAAEPADVDAETTSHEAVSAEPAEAPVTETPAAEAADDAAEPAKDVASDTSEAADEAESVEATDEGAKGPA